MTEAYCDPSGREFSYLDFCNSVRRRASDARLHGILNGADTWMSLVVACWKDEEVVSTPRRVSARQGLLAVLAVAELVTRT